MVEFIPEYDSLNVDEVTEHLDNLTGDQLIRLRLYESGNKDRVTIKDAIESELDGRDWEPESLSTNDGDDGPDGIEEREMPESDEGLSSSDEGVEEVTVRVDGRGYFGGHWFDSAGEYTVQKDLRLEQALESNRDIRRV